MLNRVKICDDVLRLGTLDNIQILDTPENKGLKALSPPFEAWIKNKELLA